MPDSVCRVCNERHGSIVCVPCLDLSEEIRAESGARDAALRSKCTWEQLSRCAVLKEYGDPAAWDSANTRT